MSLPKSPSSSTLHDAIRNFSVQSEELTKLLNGLGGDDVSHDNTASTQLLGDGSFSGRSGASSESEEEGGSTSGSDCSGDSSGSDWCSDYEDLEAELLTGTAKRRNSSPALLAMDEQPDIADEGNHLGKGLMNLKSRMRRCESSSYLQDPAEQPLPETIENPYASTKPDDLLQEILDGFSAARFPSNTWHDYFLEMQEEHIEAYTAEVERAIRDENFPKLRTILRNGGTLQCCNRHGESILHIACRRGSTDLIRFLLHEANVDPRIRDDVGRTPLHDACWSHKPNYDVVKVLLEEAPELLFIIDHRGFTPLTYCPKESWGQWCEFLQEHRAFLREMVKSLRFDRARYFVKTMIPCLKF